MTDELPKHLLALRGGQHFRVPHAADVDVQRHEAGSGHDWTRRAARAAVIDACADMEGMDERAALPSVSSGE